MSQIVVAKPKHISLNPPQHGGWAFVGLPVVVAWTVGGFTLSTALAGIAFIFSFPALYFVGAWLRYPNRDRYVRPLAIWLSPTVVLGIAAIILTPALLYWAPVYLVLGIVSLINTKRKRDRELTNEVLQLIQCSLIVPTLATATGRLTETPVLVSTALVALALIGSVLAVRGLIRKKDDLVFRRSAKMVAAVSLPISVAVGLVVGVTPAIVAGIAFTFALVRALVVKPSTLKPGILGMIELVFFILVWLACLTAVLAS